MRRRRANNRARLRNEFELPAGPVRLNRGERELLDLYRSLAPPLQERLLTVVRLIAAPGGSPPQIDRDRRG